ncbi:DMT family transporter [Winogradskya humida]|uniref:Transporter n=1 Tax=Winogradskya humida TaxID=113566 RepID=A0ABQ3ZER4_9ACTN|nr:EamA family transporter [Actinoplanes humidus]GIE17037.1 transporter [Actinoplanes humidus]
MRTDRRLTLLALVTAGLLWGTTIPLTKVALSGVGPGWLTVFRFTLAALPLAILARRSLRAAISPSVIAWGGIGYGAALVLQNIGIGHTSVSHAALIVGAVPVLVAVLGLVSGRGTTGLGTWAGLSLSLLGIGVIASHGGGSATLAGDAMVGGSALLSALFVIAQPRLLSGRDPVAVTAVQLAAGAAAGLPAALSSGLPPMPDVTPAVAMVTLAFAGTLVPFTLFAYGQSRVSPAAAGAFLNLEPLVGFLLGVVAFGDAFAGPQLAGGLAILTGLALTSLPMLRRTPAPIQESAVHAESAALAEFAVPERVTVLAESGRY